jgi:hypothetical protein
MRSLLQNLCRWERPCKRLEIILRIKKASKNRLIWWTIRLKGSRCRLGPDRLWWAVATPVVMHRLYAPHRSGTGSFSSIRHRTPQIRFNVMLTRISLMVILLAEKSGWYRIQYARYHARSKNQHSFFWAGYEDPVSQRHFFTDRHGESRDRSKTFGG